MECSEKHPSTSLSHNRGTSGGGHQRFGFPITASLISEKFFVQSELVFANHFSTFFI